MRILKWVLLILLAVVLLALAGFTAWAYTPLGPMPEAMAALQSDAASAGGTSPWLTFTPAGSSADDRLHLLPRRPGGRALPMCGRVRHCRAGYLVVITPVPFNLAVFKPAAADAVIAAHPEITGWAIGGHSLGGAMAANYVYTHPDAVQGLALWAGYPAGNNGLADRHSPSSRSTARSTGWRRRFEVDASRALLPPDTRYVPIEGGNHAQMGWYGPQPGDGTATISREAQQAQVIDATLQLLTQIGK